MNIVDNAGGLAEGRLTRGDNPVLMPMDLVPEIIEGVKLVVILLRIAETEASGQ